MHLPGLFTLPDWLVLGVAAAVLLYLYAARHRNYWKNQNVVSEDYALIFGPFLKILNTPFFAIDQARYLKYGKLFGIFEGGKPTLIVAEPELVKRVLVKDFAALPHRRRFAFNDPLLDNLMVAAPVEQWRKIRPAASPAFSTGKLRKMNNLIEDSARLMANHLQAAAENEEDIDVKQFFSDFALDTIARCAFGTTLDSRNEQSNEFVTKARKAFTTDMTPKLILFFLFPGLFKLLRMKPFDSDIFQYFKLLSLNIIKQRKEKNTRNEDFLQLMVDAQEGNLSETGENSTSAETKLFELVDESRPEQFLANRGLTEDEAMSQCILFFIAGQDTTSSVLAFTTYLLALHPEIQDRLREEVDECFQKHGQHPSLDVVSKLQYLHGVVSESMRMYPPGVRIERSTVGTYTLGDTGITVPNGCVVAIPVYAMHHDPEYFPNPEKFDPERFSEENVSSIRPYTYLPFGAGPRNCIGMRFALHAVKLCIMHAVHNVQFVRTSKTKVPLSFFTGLGALNARDMTLGIRALPVR